MFSHSLRYASFDSALTGYARDERREGGAYSVRPERKAPCA